MLDNIIYIKFSRERDRKFQISTSIKLKDENYEVVKRSIYPEAKEHLNKMFDYYKIYNDKIAKTKLVELCPCVLKNGELIFKYIDGTTLEEELNNLINNKKRETFLEKLFLLKEIIELGEKVIFENTQEFIDIFGEQKQIVGLNSSIVSNLDLISSNIIFGEKNYIIDYEWIFLFPIPDMFVLFRSLYHSPAIQRLEENEIRELYSKLGIDMNLKPVFIDMEEKFQKFVLGDNSKIQEIEDQIGSKVIVDAVPDVLERIGELRIKKLRIDGKTEMINQAYTSNRVSKELFLESDVEYIEIYPSKINCVLSIEKLIGVSGATKEEVVFITNAKRIIGSTYYFSELPCIKIENSSYLKLIFDFLIHYRDSNSTINVIELTEDKYKQNESMTEIIKELEEKNKELIEMNDFLKLNTLQKLKLKIKSFGKKEL